MPVPNTMADLAPVAGDNYPVGSEPIGNNLDNYLRAHAALIRQGNALASSTMPAGSTVNIANANGEHVQISGDATINSLGTGFVGCRREVRFLGSCTVVHSNAIQLPYASNLSTAAGHIYTFRCIGNNMWALVASSHDRGHLPAWADIDPSSKQNALGFHPVQQGGGSGQGTNKLYMGWDGAGVRVTVDATDIGRIWTTENFDPASKAGVGGVAGNFTVGATLSSSKAQTDEFDLANPNGGTNIRWNAVMAGNGTTDLINNRGGGGGGFIFADRADTSDTPVVSHLLLPTGRVRVKVANSTSLAEMPRVFVQDSDPGGAAEVGDLWIW